MQMRHGVTFFKFRKIIPGQRKIGHFCRGQQHFEAETEKSKEYPKFSKMVFLRSGEYLSAEIQFRKVITAVATRLSKYCVVH